MVRNAALISANAMSDIVLEYSHYLQRCPLTHEKCLWKLLSKVCLDARDSTEVVPAAKVLHVVHLNLTKVAHSCTHGPKVEGKSESHWVCTCVRHHCRCELLWRTLKQSSSV